MSNFRTFLVGCLLLFIWACDDHSGGPTALSPDVGVVDQGAPDVQPDLMIDMAEPDYGEAAYVEVNIAPRKALYTQDENPTVRAVVYDRLGNELEGYPVRFDTRPIESASVTESGEVSFLREGAGAIRGCATPDLCGRVSFFVDNAPPMLEVIAPERGGFVSGEPTIEVMGRTDPEGVRIYLNDQELEVDEEGNFASSIPAEFGLNLVDLIADDGIRRPPTRSVREVVWSPEILPRNIPINNLDNVATVRVDQTALDAANVMNAPDANPLMAASLTEVLELLFSRIDPMQFVPDTQLLDSQTINLELLGLSPGTPSMDVIFINDGVEVFFGLDAVTVDMAGEINYQDENLSLDGQILVDASAFVQVFVRGGEQGSFSLELGEYAVSIERIAANMENETVQILLEGIGNIAGDTIRTFLRTYLGVLVEERVPEILDLSLDSLFDPLQQVPVEVDSDPLGAGRVDFTLLNATPRIVPNDALYFELAGAFEEPADVVPFHETPGVPGFMETAEPVWPALAPVSVAIRLSTLNYLLDSLWRQGILQIDLTDQIPAALRILVSSARLDARLPPLVVPSPVGAPDELIFQLGELDLIMESPMRMEPDIYVASIRAGFYVDLAEGEIRLGLSADSAEIKFELLQAQDGRPILQPSALNGLVEENLWPTIERSLGEVLSVDLEPMLVDSESIREAIPTFDQMLFRPVFSDLPRAKNGWIVGGGTAEIEIQLRD